jgi:hypothetical protein
VASFLAHWSHGEDCSNFALRLVDNANNLKFQSMYLEEIQSGTVLGLHHHVTTLQEPRT